jgi:AAHS family benzoate transporter-like MFS transporter
VLNGGAVVGAVAGSRFADRFGAKFVISVFLLIGAVFIAALTIAVPLGVLLVFVALAGMGTSGTQILLFGFVANYYRTNVRAAGVAWCAGFGRLGGIGGPVIGGIMIGAAMGVTQIFLILAGAALVGLVVILLVPRHRAQPTVVVVEPSNSTAPASTSVAGSR